MSKIKTAMLSDEKTNKEILSRLAKIQEKAKQHDEDIATIFRYLKQLLKKSQQEEID